MASDGRHVTERPTLGIAPLRHFGNEFVSSGTENVRCAWKNAGAKRRQCEAMNSIYRVIPAPGKRLS